MSGQSITRIQTTVLTPGSASAELLVLDEALSFWGGFDPVNGTILDRHHSQAGRSVSGRIIVMPSSRGSAGTPAGVAESIRLNTGPVAIILRHRDINIAIGAMVANELYGTSVPVLTAGEIEYQQLIDGLHAEIATDGTVQITG
ncbi:aconitase X swivel domain-containing protein [Hoeflea poritis]|uniref:DUF126 domain-containing protein n=1 Tax=Hoeflea poritis TaxID=2993659 RepID=A0ABT4VJN5_9HYPH|nr:DUF126 domain-containing protein [Hoeflea poritis]MDA4844911.1 DUF126 domain-containing protein [Hoeflea poritis]